MDKGDETFIFFIGITVGVLVFIGGLCMGRYTVYKDINIENSEVHK